MIAVDTNILVYAAREELPRHEEALGALRDLAEGDAAWALPVFCAAEFLRVVTHPRLLDPPTAMGDALASLDSLLSSPTVRLLSPGERFWGIFESTIRSSAVTGNLVFDAVIAAVCVEHGAGTLLTEDRDFTRFPGIRVLGLSDTGA